MLTRFRRLSKEVGSGNTILYLLDRCLGAMSGARARLFRYYLVSQPVPGQPILPARRGAAIDVVQIAADDPRIADFPRPQPVIRFRYEQAALALSAYQDGRFVGCLWLTFGPYNEDEVRCRFAPEPATEVAWDFDVYVDPAHRVGFVFARLWDEANQRMREAGIRWSASRISAFNAGSIAAHRRLGGRIVGSAVFVRLGPIQLMISGLRPYFHVGLSRYSVPVLRFNAARKAAVP